MERPIEQPVTIQKPGPGRDMESVTTHPAYCQIGAFRSQGGHTALYDSDFMHNSIMTIRISRSELHRNLNRDWHFGREEIVEIRMSEAQWATFVSAPNMGSGVPCTLRCFGNEIIPDLPDPTSRTEQFKEEMKEDLREAVGAMDELMAVIDDLGLPKGKAEKIKEQARRARMKLTSTLPFVAEQFDEHMENTVEKAKQEVHGYMNSVIQRAGLDALTGGATMPLQIEHKE